MAAENLQGQIDSISAGRRKMFQQNRDKAVSGVNAAGQAAGDALTRRFAAIGQSGSGAQMAANIKQNEVNQNAITQANAGIDQAELQAQEGDLNRAYQQKNIEDARNLQASQFDKDFGLKSKASDLAQKQFDMDRETTAFNMQMSRDEADRKPGLLGGGGVLGTGIKLGKEGK